MGSHTHTGFRIVTAPICPTSRLPMGCPSGISNSGARLMYRLHSSPATNSTTVLDCAYFHTCAVPSDLLPWLKVIRLPRTRSANVQRITSTNLVLTLSVVFTAMFLVYENFVCGGAGVASLVTLASTPIADSGACVLPSALIIHKFWQHIHRSRSGVFEARRALESV